MAEGVGEGQRCRAEIDVGSEEGLDEDLANGLGEYGSGERMNVDAD